MTYVVWSDMFSVRMPYIDNQHKKLLEIANDFHAALKDNKDRKSLFEILNSLIHYTEEHFRDEEEIMEMAGFPAVDMESHKKIHEQLVRDIFGLHQGFTNSEEKTTHELEIFLNNWLVQHILLEDKKYEPYCENLTDYRPRK
jgi:hemerythrin